MPRDAWREQATADFEAIEWQVTNTGGVEDRVRLNPHEAVFTAGRLPHDDRGKPYVPAWVRAEDAQGEVRYFHAEVTAGEGAAVYLHNSEINRMDPRVRFTAATQVAYLGKRARDAHKLALLGLAIAVIGFFLDGCVSMGSTLRGVDPSSPHLVTVSLDVIFWLLAAALVMKIVGAVLAFWKGVLDKG